jgi:hypothetical protein
MTMPPAGPPPGYQGPQGPQQNGPQLRPGQGYQDQTVAMPRPNQPGPQQNPQQNPQQSPQQNPQQNLQQSPQQNLQQSPPRMPAAPRPKGAHAALILGLISVAGVVLGLTISENGHNAWDSVNAWGAVAIAGALAVLAPALGRTFGLTEQRAWQVAVCGAGALILYWVLFVLPSVGSNTSLLTTIGVAAGVIAAWIAPGRLDAPGGAPQRW